MQEIDVPHFVLLDSIHFITVRIYWIYSVLFFLLNFLTPFDQFLFHSNELLLKFFGHGIFTNSSYHRVPTCTKTIMRQFLFLLPLYHLLLEKNKKMSRYHVYEFNFLRVTSLVMIIGIDLTLFLFFILENFIFSNYYY